ncbi:MAG: DUF6249 domain-containing protein [Hyphomonadaceae bacterium]
MGPEIVVPVGLILMIIAIVWLTNHFAAKKKSEAFQTLRLAIEKGQEVSPAAMEAMSRMAHPLADLRRGIVFLALAGAVAAFGLLISPMEDAEEALRPILAISMFPLFIGVAFLGLHFFTREKAAE